MVKRINPLTGVLYTLEGLVDNVIGATSRYRADALTDELEGDITVDTCVAGDTQMWETGVKRNDTWLIVDQYEDEDKAKKGHKKWVDDLPILTCGDWKSC